MCYEQGWRLGGLVGYHVGLDKMNKRWTDRIDVYYGLNLKGALKFGKQRVRIFWKTDSPAKSGV